MSGYDAVMIAAQAAEDAGYAHTRRDEGHLVIDIAQERACLHVRTVTPSRMEVIFDVAIRALWPELLYPGPLVEARGPLNRCPVMLGNRRDGEGGWCSGIVHALFALLHEPGAIEPLVKLLLDAHKACGEPRAFDYLGCEEWYHKGRWCVRFGWEKKEPGLLSRVKEGEPERTLKELVAGWCEALSCLMRARHAATSPQSVLDVWSPLIQPVEHPYVAYPALVMWCQRERERLMLALVMTDRAISRRGWPGLKRPDLGVHARVMITQRLHAGVHGSLYSRLSRLLCGQSMRELGFDHTLQTLTLRDEEVGSPMLWAMSFLPEMKVVMSRDHGSHHRNPEWQAMLWLTFDEGARRDALAHLGNLMCERAGLGPQHLFLHQEGMVLPWPVPGPHDLDEVHQALMQGRRLDAEREAHVLTHVDSPAVLKTHDLICQVLELIAEESPWVEQRAKGSLWLEPATGYEWLALWWRARLTAHQIPRGRWHTGERVALHNRYGAMCAMTSRFFHDDGRACRAWLRFMCVSDQYKGLLWRQRELTGLFGRDTDHVWLMMTGMQERLLAMPADGSLLADWEVEVAYTFLLTCARRYPGALDAPALYAPWMAMAMTRLPHQLLVQLDRMLEFVPMPEVLAHLDRLVHHHPDPAHRERLAKEQRELAKKIERGEIQVVQPHLEGAVQLAEQAGEQGGLSITQEHSE